MLATHVTDVVVIIIKDLNFDHGTYSLYTVSHKKKSTNRCAAEYSYI